MNFRWIHAATVALAMGGCANKQAQQATNAAQDYQFARTSEPAEVGERKVRIDQTPPAVQKTIERELIGAELEDIAKIQRDGKPAYETDIIKSGAKCEVVIAEDGSVISKIREGADEDKPQAQQAGWRQSFEVN